MSVTIDIMSSYKRQSPSRERNKKNTVKRTLGLCTTLRVCVCVCVCVDYNWVLLCVVV